MPILGTSKSKAGRWITCQFQPLRWQTGLFSSPPQNHNIASISLLNSGHARIHPGMNAATCNEAESPHRSRPRGHRRKLSSSPQDRMYNSSLGKITDFWGLPLCRPSREAFVTGQSPPTACLASQFKPPEQKNRPHDVTVGSGWNSRAA